MDDILSESGVPQIMSGDCVFCQIAAGKADASIIWKDEAFLAIKNKYPKAPVHILVLPIEHTSKIDLASGQVPEFWTSLMKAVFTVVRQLHLDKSGYKLVNNGGGYNHFDHEHIHIMGGTESEPGGQT